MHIGEQTKTASTTPGKSEHVVFQPVPYRMPCTAPPEPAFGQSIDSGEESEEKKIQ